MRNDAQTLGNGVQLGVQSIQANVIAGGIQIPGSKLSTIFGS